MSTQVRERVQRSEVRQIGVSRMPLGLSIGETIAVVVAAVVLILALVYYFTSLKPEQDRLRTIETELEAQQRNILASTPQAGALVTSVEDEAKTALETLETFRNNYLKTFASGRIALIRQINALAKKNNVTLTSGIDMGASGVEAEAENDLTGEKKSTSSRKKADDLLNAFPSVSFRFIIFGQYSNVRTFINEVEHDKQFVVISSVNLVNQEAKSASRRSRGGESASGIMVTIDMTAYFQPA